MSSLFSPLFDNNLVPQEPRTIYVNPLNYIGLVITAATQKHRLIIWCGLSHSRSFPILLYSDLPYFGGEKYRIDTVINTEYLSPNDVSD